MALSGQLARNLKGVFDLLGKRGSAQREIIPEGQKSIEVIGPWKGTAPGQAERATKATVPQIYPKTATDQDLHDMVRMLLSQEDRAAMGPTGELTKPILEDAPRVLRSQTERARGSTTDIEDFYDPSTTTSPENAIIGMADKSFWREGKAELVLTPDEIVQKNLKIIKEANKIREAQGLKVWNLDEINSVIASSPIYRRQLANYAGVPLDQVRDIELHSIDEFAKAAAKGDQRQLEKLIRTAGKDPAGDPAKGIQLGGETLLNALFNQPRRIGGVPEVPKKGAGGGLQFAGEAALMRALYGAFKRPEKVASNIERQSVDPNLALAEIMQGRPGPGPNIAQGIEAGIGPEGMLSNTHTGFSRSGIGQRADELALQEQLNIRAAEPDDLRLGQGGAEFDPRYDKTPEMPVSERQMVGAVPLDDLRATKSGKLGEIDWEGDVSRRQIDDIAEEIQGQRLNAPHRMVETAKEKIKPVVDREANFEMVARVRESLDQLRADIGEGRSFVKAKPGVDKAEFGDVARTIGRKSKTVPDFVDKAGLQRHRVTEKGRLGLSSKEITDQQRMRAMVDDAESALERANEIGDPALTRQLGSAIASGNRESIKKAIGAIPGHEPSGGTVFGGPAPALKGRAAVQKYETEIFKLDKQLDRLRERARMLPKDSKARAAINAEGIRIKRQKADLEGAAKEVEGAITPSRRTRFERKQGAKVAENLRRSAVETEGSESLKAKYGDQPDDIGFTGSVEEALEESARPRIGLADELYEMPDVEFGGAKAPATGEPVTGQLHLRQQKLDPTLQRHLARRRMIEALGPSETLAEDTQAAVEGFRAGRLSNRYAMPGTFRQGGKDMPLGRADKAETTKGTPTRQPIKYESVPSAKMRKPSPLANILDGKEIEVVERLGVADELVELFKSKGIKGDISREQFVKLLDQVIAQ